MKFRHWLPLSCVLSVLALAPCVPAAANSDVVIYRCTDARGEVTLQNDKPCPKGSAQQKRVVTPAPSIAPAPPRATTVPMTTPASTEPPQAAPSAQPQPASPVLPLPAARTPLAQRLPPPPLYQCNTPDNDSYLSDTPEPKPRCVRVDTVGIDGSSQLGAGEACSMVFDQCQRVADGAACDAWRKRVREAQSAWTYGRADSAARLREDYERIARVVAETTCNE